MNDEKKIELVKELARLMMVTRSQIQQQMKRHDLPCNVESVRTLDELLNHPGINSHQLCQLTGFDKAHIARKVTEFEQKQLVYRQKDQKDKRITQLYLTAEGMEVARCCITLRNQTVLELMAGIQPNALESLNIFLESFKAENQK
ncbi:hypothetical protein A9D46_14955 [Photobacterium damselae subsp. damselae]|uniref:MarR family winged helix-turn-helix transcriptional regulator n=1 Tax=Photobacterium damselae TaxID=38293 RepID=UPI00084A403E|nr:MarR family transcriptional regulator [Photobacterium damselae]OEC82360.1 hypothetical protein A9D46_14955 [Photobacterium damselae subsp. damselae]